MRHDNIGLFWEDLPREKGKIVREMPPIPNTGWTMPKSFPNLSRCSCLSLDVETYDPGLKKFGPGWARGVGHLVGVSIGAPGGGKWYFPMRHEIEPENNMNPEHVLAWLKDTLSNPLQPKIGANIIYDIGWLLEEGVDVKGELVDVQYAEALLSEDKSVSLENISQKYLNEGKESNELYQWCSSFYGGGVTPSQRANIYRSPARLVGLYAESDADLPLRLAPILYQKLKEQGLVDLFKLECNLIRVILKMRLRGVKVAVDKAVELNSILAQKRDKEQELLNKLVGFKININQKPPLQKAFDSLGIPYPLTEKGNPSFTKSFLASVKHPIAEHIHNIRKYEKLRGTFVQSYILDSHIKGRVYGQFHPLRSDKGGTRSGRFSSSNPNLQNIPSRDKELAPLIRGLFLPDYPEQQWIRFDYSQIEYRMLVHYAVGASGDTVRSIYAANPKTDYHKMTQDLIKSVTGMNFSRKHTKNINFGLIYGMGVNSLADSLGVDLKEAKKFIEAYHKGAPFASATMKFISAKARDTGLITTILGRRSRFDLWEPEDWDSRTIPLQYDKAIKKWDMSTITRAYTYKALNRLLQGSAADVMKMALWKCEEAGIFREVGYPALTVHDELDMPISKGQEPVFKEMKHIMETCIPLRVPLLASTEIGSDWGHCKEIDF